MTIPTEIPTEIYIETSGALNWEGDRLATVAEFEYSDRCIGSLFEALEPGEIISLKEGIFVLNKDLDLCKDLYTRHKVETQG